VSRLALTAFVSSVALLCGASTASAAVFTNPAPITITDVANGTPDTGSPYPSSIVVGGLGSVTDVNVTLFSYSHTNPDDIGVLLVGPGGQGLELMSGAGGIEDASGLQFTFDDSAAAQLPSDGALAAGTYKPTGYDRLIYPAPGPGLAYNNPGPDRGGTATLASTFNALPANGTWNLFVRDTYDMDSGAIAGGWALDLTAAPLAKKKKKCKKRKNAAKKRKKKCKRKKKRK